jgi:outer membrane protein TolC
MSILFLLFMAAAVQAKGEEGPRQLSLKEALMLAVERNLDVRAEMYNSAIAEAELRRNRSVYDPRLTFLTNYQDSTTLPPSAFLAGVSTSEQKVFKANAGINRLLPTGGNVGAGFNNTWNRNNATSPGFMNNYWQSDLTVTLTQPLLKNFGRESTEINIAVAAYGKEGSLEHFRARLMDTVFHVRNEYFALYSLREELIVKQTSLALARKILKETRSRVKIGVLPAMEILNAEFGVAMREKELIDAERAVRDQNDALMLILQIAKPQEIIPSDPPSREEYRIEETEAISTALAMRPDLAEARLSIKSSELQARVAGNLTLPDLKFNASAGLTGLAGEYRRDLERVASTDYPVWSVGLNLDYPLGNGVARNEAIRNRLKVEQGRTQLKGMEEAVAKEVRSAARGVSANYKQIEVADRGLAFAEERLRSFIRKNEAGMATTRDVLDVETDLATAKSNRIKALVNYAGALSRFWKATGELLAKERIVVNEKDADALYEGRR